MSNNNTITNATIDEGGGGGGGSCSGITTTTTTMVGKTTEHSTPTPTPTTTTTTTTMISESDKVYDRQIRLWGAEAQAKMAQCKVLYIHVTGISSEIIKNLVLAGIRAVICDDRVFPDAVQDTPLSVFITNQDRNIHTASKIESEATSTSYHPPPPHEEQPQQRPIKKMKQTVADVMKSKIEELNPLLGECEICNDPIHSLSEEYISQFQIIVASRITNITDIVRIATICTSHKYQNKFYMVDCFGLYGGSIFDLSTYHTYRPEIGKTLLDITTIQPHVPFETILFHIPLHEAVNRFHKLHPPSIYIQYRCILEYIIQKKTWPNHQNALDFVRTIQQWIQTTSSSLIHHESLTHDALFHLAQVANVEVAPICSILGGILGNEIIKVISGKGEPANNTLLLDGTTCKTMQFLIQPRKK